MRQYFWIALVCLLNFMTGISLVPAGFKARHLQGRRCTATVAVPLSAPAILPYDIVIGTDIFAAGTETFTKLSHISKALIVTNDVVAELYLEELMRSLEAAGIDASSVVLPDGENFKDINAVVKVLDAAVAARLDRKSSIIALGGGVVGDIGGFAAAVYHRGINVVQVPTTLMAMVDSSVGGKTGVNHPVGGKNAIGAFHQPGLVLADLRLLGSLSDKQFCSGLAEAVKYGLVWDATLFEWLEDNMHRVVQREPDAVSTLVRRCCEAKAAIVSADVREGESGLRATLNLGHTFAHAIETGLGYGALLHGEAVAVGVVMAAQLSAALGYVQPELVRRVKRLLQRASLPISLQGASAWLNHGLGDKVNSLDADTLLDLMAR
jgi:3-dehydroquinate synthase